MLLKEELITEDQVKMVLSWGHTGFHVHNEGKVVSNDAEGRGSACIERSEKRLARYLMRPPVSLERLTFFASLNASTADRENQQVSLYGAYPTPHTIS